ncbi:MAG: hypothetical protein DRH12_07835 [Deltaproteobacteria bacterium]|nr:MAG: hypothetical protein DRH12_07835 [Deltaproteobacteria bacterium]
MSLRVDKTSLERACKEIIETILFCLPNAYKGTVYSIGSPPDMVATRVTSGIIDRERTTISWGLPERSDYNPPGKPWLQYRDEPGRPLEAMAWCVEKQKSWTAEDPDSDTRSVRVQLGGGYEDSHHMEPVLVRKQDLYLDGEPVLEYPRNYDGEVIWQDTDYMVVAVIKIHFRLGTIKMDSPETRLIKKLSRTLGTELLSYQLREESLKAMRELAQDKVNSCNIISDSLRNTISKSGLIFSLIKHEMGFLRDQWEEIIRERCNIKDAKEDYIEELDRALDSTAGVDDRLRSELKEAHKKFLEFSLTPEKAENWIRAKIESKWNTILTGNNGSNELSEKVRRSLDGLRNTLYVGKDSALIKSYDKMPEKLKQEWVDLIYRMPDRFDQVFLDKVIDMLGNPALKLPHQNKSRKSLIHLRALAKIMGELEENTNVAIRQVLNGGSTNHFLRQSK